MYVIQKNAINQIIKSTTNNIQDYVSNNEYLLISEKTEREAVGRHLHYVMGLYGFCSISINF